MNLRITFKTHLFLITFLASCYSIASSSFEGYIDYEIDVKPLNSKLTVEYLRGLYGTNIRTYFQGGKYRIDTSGGNTDWEIYHSETNTQYLKMNSSSEVQAFDGAEENRGVQSIVSEDSEEIIMGRQTKLFKIQYADGSISKYWYDPSIFISPKQFEKLRFGYLEIKGSVLINHIFCWVFSETLGRPRVADFSFIPVNSATCCLNLLLPKTISFWVQ